MSYRDKIRKLAETARKTSIESGEDDLKFISDQLDKISKYHNHVIQMEQQMDFQKFRLEGQDFRDWLEDQNRTRIHIHKTMIDGVIILNRYCKANNIDLFYEGKIDEKLRYDDNDTRFGIAEFADKYCSEIFQVGIGKPVETHHSKIISQMIEKGEAMENQTSDHSDIHLPEI